MKKNARVSEKVVSPGLPGFTGSYVPVSYNIQRILKLFCLSQILTISYSYNSNSRAVIISLHSSST